MDLKGAFDNLRHASVGQYLICMDSSSAWAADMLLPLLVSQTLDFNFMQEKWSIHSTSGAPQGGCHSAGLLARTLDFFLGKLAITWPQRGFTAAFDPLWLLLYVDGTGGKPRLLCHLSWTRYPPSACKSTVKAKSSSPQFCLELRMPNVPSPPCANSNGVRPQHIISTDLLDMR